MPKSEETSVDDAKRMAADLILSLAFASETTDLNLRRFINVYPSYEVWRRLEAWLALGWAEVLFLRGFLFLGVWRRARLKPFDWP